MKTIVPNLLGATSVNPKLNFCRRLFFALALLIIAVLAAPAAAQQGAQPSATPEIVFKQVAPDLYFLFDFESSNAGVLITEEGALVIDTHQHPRDGQDLLDRIRKITDKPVKWVVNSHFHGDHTYGNSVFKAAGATIVAQRDTARLMQQVAAKEFARRGQFFARRGYDPKEVKLVLPDVTFDQEMTIRLGGKEVRLIYLGPGQNPGDTFILFPHARVLYTPGAFGRRSMPNMAFTPSVDNWIKLLGQVAAMDVDKVLPAHGDMATRADLPELAKFLADEYTAVKNAVAAGVKVEEAVKTLTLPEYKDWRNYNRREQEIRSLYELIGTGKRGYFE
jgi:glyoxylase-like metal-dependent hydrolase (beta-lactamase superfamily II)